MSIPGNSFISLVPRGYFFQIRVHHLEFFMFGDALKVANWTLNFLMLASPHINHTTTIITIHYLRMTVNCIDRDRIATSHVVKGLRQITLIIFIYSHALPYNRERCAVGEELQESLVLLVKCKEVI